MKTPLFGLTLVKLQTLFKTYALPSFAARQVTNWLYHNDIGSVEEMTNLSLPARALLS